MIDSFTGEYAFLSNFYTVTGGGKSVEHYYQAFKAKDQTSYNYVFDAPTAKEAKKRGREITMRSDWDEIKDEIMYMCLLMKFKHSPLKEKLLATGNEELVEGNWWHDTYWGVCNGVGENKLGKFLMKVREELRNND